MSELRKKMQALEEAIEKTRMHQTLIDAMIACSAWNWEEAGEHNLQVAMNYIGARCREIEKEIEELLIVSNDL